MGCEFPAIKGSEPADLCALRQEGQLLRADFLDAFARLESAVMLYVEKPRSEEHTSELQSLMRTSYAVFCLKKNTLHIITSTILQIYTLSTRINHDTRL